MFLGVEGKIFVLSTFYFIGLLIVVKRNIWYNVRTKRVDEGDFFAEGTYRFYSQLCFFCIIGYIVFQFKHIIFEYTYGFFCTLIDDT